MRILMDYSWPGNVRELKSTIEFAAINCQGSIIQPKDLPFEIVGPGRHKGLPGSAGEDLESQFLLAALEKPEGNHTLAARMLGIGRSTLYRHMAKLGIDPEDRRFTRLTIPIHGQKLTSDC